MNRLFVAQNFFRSFYASVCQSAKPTDRYLAKFLRGKKKRNWYDTPVFSSLDNVLSSTKGVKNPGAGRRSRQLSVILHQYVTDMIHGGEVDQELMDRGVQITKVKLMPDLSGLNVTWEAMGTEEDEKIQEMLDKNASKLRSSLSSMHIMPKIPKITFVKDVHTARHAEVERLLKIADMGPKVDPAESDSYAESDSECGDETSGSDSELRNSEKNRDFRHKTNILDLNHASLMKSVILSKGKAHNRTFGAESTELFDFKVEEVKREHSGIFFKDKNWKRKDNKFRSNRNGRVYEEDLSNYEDRYCDASDEVPVYDDRFFDDESIIDEK